MYQQLSFLQEIWVTWHVISTPWEALKHRVCDWNLMKHWCWLLFVPSQNPCCCLHGLMKVWPTVLKDCFDQWEALWISANICHCWGCMKICGSQLVKQVWNKAYTFFFCISGKTSALVSAFLAKFNFVIDAMAAVPHNKHNVVRGGRLWH